MASYSERLDFVRKKIEAPEQLAKFKRAAAPGVEIESFVQALFVACANNLKVLNADVKSLSEALMDSVTLGLKIGGVLGYGYVVPYGGKARFQAGYLGLLKMAYQSENVTTAAAEVVRGQLKGRMDKFNYELGSTPYVRHEIDSLPDDPILWCWACISVKQGPPFISVWDAARLEKHAQQYVTKDKSGKFYSDTLVVTNYTMWCKKTMLRQCLKLVPMSEVAHRVLAREDYADEGVEEPAMPSGAVQETEDLKEFIDASMAEEHS